ncbi:kunitz-like toxin PcKuz3 [Musca autumnalis]|uniref:kunitz-like toxin PcKuz3 n=1 Tax=Musca autumnalis TaxID=221902 RepID=UPI003CF1C83C
MNIYFIICLYFVHSTTMATILIEDISSQCSLPHSQTGLCRARIPAWSFNGETGSCEKFIFGGCGGNINRFATKVACENQCLEIY